MRGRDKYVMSLVLNGEREADKDGSQNRTVNIRSLFTPTESRSESEKDQRTIKIKENVCFLLRLSLGVNGS